MSARRIVALEEHLVTGPVQAAWRDHEARWQNHGLADVHQRWAGQLVAGTGAERLAAMDEAGIDVQVLSLATPGSQNLDAGPAVALQCQTNDLIATLVRERPDRFHGLATLATPDPDQAVGELERAVTVLGLDGAMVFGRTRERSLDHQDFWPIFEAAEALRAPLYLHPQSSPPARRDADRAGLKPALDATYATHGLDWHYETGAQLLRLILAGIFDRFPHLHVITGHWGELVLFHLDRIDTLPDVAHLQRPPSQYVHTNLFVTASGMLSHRHLQWAKEILGADRILFATDYPYVPLPAGTANGFFDQTDLAEAERDQIAWQNWSRIRAGILR